MVHLYYVHLPALDIIIYHFLATGNPGAGAISHRMDHPASIQDPWNCDGWYICDDKGPLFFTGKAVEICLSLM